MQVQRGRQGAELQKTRASLSRFSQYCYCCWYLPGTYWVPSFLGCSFSARQALVPHSANEGKGNFGSSGNCPKVTPSGTKGDLLEPGSLPQNPYC